MKIKAIKWIVGLLVVAAAAWFFFANKLGTQDEILRDFSIRDTAQVTRLFIANTENSSILVMRQPDQTWWVMEGEVPKFRARDDAIYNILKTISRIEVKQPVPKSALNTVIRTIAGRHSKVEIYTDSDVPEKIWYVGGATKDNHGTYMLLEIPGVGKSSVPLIMHISGSYGYLSSRFFTDPIDWKYTGLFDGPVADIRKIEVKYPPRPASSFRIDYSGGNDITLFSDSLNAQVTVFDTVAVKNYMLSFKKIHYESHPRHLNQQQIDSILTTQPVFTMEVAYEGGRTKKIRAHHMEIGASSRHADPDDENAQNNVDRLYGFVDEKDFVVIQYFVFNSLLMPVSEFLQ